jgi:anti-sigma-K factor RskA
MIEHAEWADSVGAYLLGALPPDERDAFEAHLRDCAACRRDVEELQVAADALPASVAPVAPPAELKDRIMAVVESEAQLLAAAGGNADRAPVKERRRKRSFGGWLMRPGVALACAAALLAGGGVAGVLIAGGDDSRTVLATTADPAADVRLEIHDDSATLVARGMPAPPEGRIYQVWLKRPGSDPEPTSVLWSTRADGSAEVAVPGSLDDVEAVLVTDERQGGAEAPTKAPVITVPTA